MMMIAEILIITDRSEILVRKLYRKEALSYDARAIFGKRLQDVRTGKTPPHFEEEGVHMYFIHRGNLYFLASSAVAVSTIGITEFLARLYSMTKDLCGVVTEESVRANFLPIFEMLSAAMDVGVVQVASTERLRPFILSDTVTVGVPPSAQEQITSRLFGIDRHVASASAPQRATVGSSVHERSLFVDVVENLTIVANSQGKVNHVKVDGRVSVRNQLPGSPTLRLALNDDLQICQPGQAKVYGKSAQLDHCKFHADVDTSEFEVKRVIKMTPAVGELSAMVYSVDGSCLLLPVMVRITVQNIENSRDSSVTIKVTPSFPPTAEAVHVRVTLPLPPSVTSISQRTVGPSESLTFCEKDRAVLWTIRSLASSQESIAHVRLISHSSQSISNTDIGPAAVEFEVNRLTLSGLFLRSVKILEGSQLCPARRFVRYVTASDSYTVKIP